MKKNTKVSLLFVALIVAVLAAHSCLAAGSLVDTSSANYKTGNYTLDDIREYAIYIMKLILSLVGTLSLLSFVYGGITFLISAGNASEVKKGMDIIKAAVVGLLITFSSVLIINLFFSGLGVSWNQNTGAVKSTSADKCASSFGSQGYSCMDKSSGKNCKTGYCPGDSNIQCCQ